MTVTRKTLRIFSRLASLALLTFLAVILTGCGSALPSHNFFAKISASSDVNPNSAGKASPIDVVVYQLKDNKVFNKAGFFALSETGKQVLRGTLISQTSISMQPGQVKELRVPLDDSARYIGVVAAFHDLSSSTWRVIWPLQASWGTESVKITLDKKEVSIVE